MLLAKKFSSNCRFASVELPGLGVGFFGLDGAGLLPLEDRENADCAPAVGAMDRARAAAVVWTRGQ